MIQTHLLQNFDFRKSHYDLNPHQTFTIDCCIKKFSVSAASKHISVFLSMTPIIELIILKVLDDFDDFHPFIHFYICP